MVEQSDKERVEALIPRFKLQQVLNNNPGARRIVLQGTIDGITGLVLIERAAFPSDEETLSNFTSNISALTALSTNDIYAWFMGKSGEALPADLKINLIWPCTPKHIAKYSPQRFRVVTETPEIYKERVLPYILSQQKEGRVDWVYNILEGRKEQDDVIFKDDDRETGFYLMPDLNWDRKTMTALHLLGIVVRRDIHSLRALQKSDIGWLKRMRDHLVSETSKLYPDIEEDELKLYLHYQPTYYHFHIHVVHVQLEAGATQAVGKAFGFENIISQLETLPEGKSMADVSLSYTIGENHDLWTEVFGPLKKATSQKS